MGMTVLDAMRVVCRAVQAAHHRLCPGEAFQPAVEAPKQQHLQQHPLLRERGAGAAAAAAAATQYAAAPLR